MTKWRARYFESADGSCSSWVVEEINDYGEVRQRIVDCGKNEDLAQRIARLPELEVVVGVFASRCWRLDESGELVQDVLVVPGMVLWYWIKGPTKYLLASYKLHIHHTESSLTEMDGWKHFYDCYNTPEAAWAVRASPCKGG